MTGLISEYLKLMNARILIGDEFPEYIAYREKQVYNKLEDIHSVGSATELQEAIDGIGDGAGTIFIESGTHVITVPIDIDGGGSLVIYGHGDNTILQPDDGINVFNITDCASLTIKNLQIDTSNYTGATSGIIANETNDNVVLFEDVSIIGGGAFGIGIELLSNNCIIEHCNISQLQDGIYLNNSNRHIIAQNILSNNARYGINLNTVLYSNIGNNTCNSNLMGIYALNSTNNSISNNICSLNTENGIYITGSSYNTISGNTCDSNDSNTANAQAGMFITNNSDFNTISGNSLNNNNNIGAGDGFGLIIATATCEENVVASNNWNGNDIDVHDRGVGTTVEYYVQDYIELQDAINSIGSGAGTINLDASFTVSATIIMDGNGSYIIQGEGSNTTLTTIGDISCFNIDTARSVILRNFMIDATSLTTATREIIDVNEDSDNIIILDNVIITGDGVNGYGIELNSANCRIENCTVDNVNIGINVLSNSNIINGNNANNCASYGIQIGADYNNITSNICNSNLTGIYVLNGTGNNINNNIVQTNIQNGIYLNGSGNNSLNDNICDGNDSNTANAQAGVYIDNNSDNNSIIGNTSINNNNIGVGNSYGIYIGNANCNMNIVRSNNISGNDIAWNDLGTNSDFEYRCSTNADIQDAIDSIATKSGTIKIISGNITIVTIIDIDGGGAYIIEGEGDNTILTSDAAAHFIFNITSCISCTIRNLKINTESITGAVATIFINEGSDNEIIIDNITFLDSAINQRATSIHINSNNITVRDCSITNSENGILTTGDVINIILDNNTISNINTNGIHINGTVNTNSHSITNNIISGSAIGIRIDKGSKLIISGNICTSNNIGIASINGASGMAIIGNSCNLNTQNGIYLSGTDGNSVSNNVCDGNDSNTANPQAGIYIDSDSNKNSIFGNIITNNNNAGAGTGYGIYIGNVNCDDNFYNINQVSGNDIQWKDLGTNTDIEYKCSTNADIQDAIDSIAAKNGTIIIIADNIVIATTIDIDGGGDYRIIGGGDSTVLTLADGVTLFNITSTTFCLIDSFLIDSTAYSGNRSVISINETTDNIVKIVNCKFTAGWASYCITAISNNIVVNNCYFDGCQRGIFVDSSSHGTFNNNYFDSNTYGFWVTGSYNIITGNSIIASTQIGVEILAGSNNLVSGNTINGGGTGIYVGNGSYNNISNNYCVNCTLQGIDIRKTTVNTLYNIVSNNHIIGGNNDGITLSYSSYGIISNNKIQGCNRDGIVAWSNVAGICDGNVISGNSISNCGNTGIMVKENSNRNIIIGNYINNPTDDGIEIIAGADDNKITGNYIYSEGDQKIVDGGTGTIFFGDDTAYNEATWNGDLGTPTKNAIRDKIESLVGGAYSGWFDDGVNFRVTVVDGIITAVDNSTGGGHNP